AAEVRARPPDDAPPGGRPDGPHRQQQGAGGDELPDLPPAARFSAAGPAGQGPGQQHGVLRWMPQDVQQVTRGWAMLNLKTNSMQRKAGAAVLAIAFSVLFLTGLAFCDKKKKKDADKPKPDLMDILDLSKIVWPKPPAIARIRYLNYFCSQKTPDAPQTKKAKWMDRLAGVAVGQQVTTEKRLWQLVTPYGLAVDSKNRLYVADSKVHAIFIFDTETKDLPLIKNGVEARFWLITGLAVYDSDRLFFSGMGNVGVEGVGAP